MKISITGHSRGVGLALYNSFSLEGHNVLGFSRSNGFDISDSLSRIKILEMSADSDIFINNAYHPEGQLLLLKEFIQEWKQKDRHIINISSKFSYFPLGKTDYDNYIIAKQKQNEVVKQHIFNGLPRILNVVTGLIDTEMSSVFVADKMSAKDLSDFIIYLINLKNKMNIQEVTIDVPNLDWANIKKKQNEI